jgi:hypothetical protein
VAEQAYLLHFVAPDYDLWRAKVEWRLSSHGYFGPMKERIISLRSQAKDDSFFPALYRRMHHLSSDLHEALVSAGFLLRIDLDLNF